MGNKHRHPEVVEFEKKRIALITAEYIQKHGFESLSIRKLAKVLHVSPTTVYNYFSSVDELYFYTLRIGFDSLYDSLLYVFEKQSDPFTRLQKMNEAVFDFGKSQSHFIDLMFILELPKYMDYLDAGKQDAAILAYQEMKSAILIRDLYKDAVLDICGKNSSLDKGKVTFYVARIFSDLIGLVTVYNSRALVYIGGKVDKHAGYILDTIGNFLKYS
ncbi:MAG TPA: TetR/AcrR family transcriptional regulator [Spirochaetota bacterium]|nr:TetR/AcrR family transcriptional regulator [Spirochaetota bacterium]HPJ34536.1 TetR/AcrR family transcriptional regulator [Spirochaetota bacterium]